ncbi:hypothetical protein [Terrabacter sp. C0L_2]|uniref:hypothetical protein n=1 Tax=Terrabacter sp. C0L_2 TaxID=3108389 RepID=UPI002ED14417|nr:hypothetical protein U5C87_17660 [Terrabacter sp. C0L_2]
MNQVEAHRLAAAVSQLRPDWPVASLSSWITKNLTERPYRDAAVALAWVAADPATTTPGRVLEAGPWWRAVVADKGTVSAVTTRCPDHPEHPAWKCPECDAETTPPPVDWRGDVTLSRRARPKTRPEPTHDLADVRARIDAEEARND